MSSGYSSNSTSNSTSYGSYSPGSYDRSPVKTHGFQESYGFDNYHRSPVGRSGRRSMSPVNRSVSGPRKLPSYEGSGSPVGNDEERELQELYDRQNYGKRGHQNDYDKIKWRSNFREKSDSSSNEQSNSEQSSEEYYDDDDDLVNGEIKTSISRIIQKHPDLTTLEISNKYANKHKHTNVGINDISFTLDQMLKQGSVEKTYDHDVRRIGWSLVFRKPKNKEFIHRIYHLHKLIRKLSGMKKFHGTKKSGSHDFKKVLKLHMKKYPHSTTHQIHEHVKHSEEKIEKVLDFWLRLGNVEKTYNVDATKIQWSYLIRNKSAMEYTHEIYILHKVINYLMLAREQKNRG